MKISHPLPQKIGEGLKVLRKSSGVRYDGYSLDRAPKAVGISASLLSGIEKGVSKGTPFTTVEMLCRLYGFHPCGMTTLNRRSGNGLPSDEDAASPMQKRALNLLQ